MSGDWRPLFEQATRQREPRLLFAVNQRAVGSVACASLPVLLAQAPSMTLSDECVQLNAPQPTEALAQINQTLRRVGLIRGWRDETYAVLPDGARAGDAPLALIERAASRFWGTLTFGAHCNGYVADAAGRPRQLWIARRSKTKATDPGKLDNLVGGGVPHGQTPLEALVREGFEEAGLDAVTMHRAQAASVLHFRCDIAEGFMNEHLHSFDLRLEPGTTPDNQDGEVDAWYCMSIEDALVRASSGDMTMDAALVTLDFALRHGLLDATQANAVGSWWPLLRWPPARGGSPRPASTP